MYHPSSRALLARMALLETLNPPDPAETPIRTATPDSFVSSDPQTAPASVDP